MLEHQRAAERDRQRPQVPGSVAIPQLQLARCAAPSRPLTVRRTVGLGRRDCDKSNSIQLDEFAQALSELQIIGTRDDYTSLFNAWDADGAWALKSSDARGPLLPPCRRAPSDPA